VSELLPCPFCGGEPTIEESDSLYDYAIACYNADCAANPRVFIEPAKQGDDIRAIANSAWNTRASCHLPAALVEEAIHYLDMMRVSKSAGDILSDYGKKTVGEITEQLRKHLPAARGNSSES
jgi:hypothetical protein